MITKETVESIVKSGLCTGCGTCVAVCPERAIVMRETPVGLLLAEVDHNMCNKCGLCSEICPGSHLSPQIMKKDIDPFKGKVLVAYCGYTINSEIRDNAQSGGVVSALLCHLIETRRINNALITKMPEDGTLRPKSYLVSDRHEILKAQGSKYCPVAVNASLPDKLGENESIAIVGLPCHIHGLRNLQSLYNSWRKGNIYSIGLFCDRVLTYRLIDYLIEKVGINSKEVNQFKYRNKLFGGASLITKNGMFHTIPNEHRIEAKDTFTPSRCRLCFDKLNILSDISVGDAWGVKEENNGFSVILVRTNKGLNIIHSALNAGVLELEEIPSEAVFKGQNVEMRCRNWATYTKIWRAWGRKSPNFQIPVSYYIIDQPDSELRQMKNLLRWAERLASKKTPQEALRASKLRQRMISIRMKVSPKRLIRILLMIIRIIKEITEKR